MNRADRWGRSLCAAAALALALGCGGEAAEWPQFRGPSGLGILDAGDLPTKWGKGSANIRWRTPMPGRGDSSPVIASGRVFVTTVIESPDGATGGEAKLHLSATPSSGSISRRASCSGRPPSSPLRGSRATGSTPTRRRLRSPTASPSTPISAPISPA